MNTIRHICISVENIEKALDFYVGLLGFSVAKLDFLSGEYISDLLGMKNTKLTYVKLQAGLCKTQVELYCFHSPGFQKHLSLNHFAVTVKDIEKEYKKLSDSGVKFFSPPQNAPDNPCKVCFCCDPDMNMIELVEDL